MIIFYVWKTVAISINLRPSRFESLLPDGSARYFWARIIEEP